MGFITILTIDRDTLDEVEAPLARLLGHNSHLDGVIDIPRRADGVVAVATVHSAETAIIQLGPEGDDVTFRTGIEAGRWGTPVPAHDRTAGGGLVDLDTGGLSPAWSGGHVGRWSAAFRDGQPPAPGTVDVPPLAWPDGPGRFVLGVREDWTRDNADVGPVAAAIRSVVEHAGPPNEGRVASHANAVFLTGFLPADGSATLIADSGVCLAVDVIADLHPDWWARIGERLSRG